LFSCCFPDLFSNLGRSKSGGDRSVADFVARVRVSTTSVVYLGTMISAVLLISKHGDVVISRFYRGDVPSDVANTFADKVIRQKNTANLPPIQYINGYSFAYMKHRDMYFVGISKGNANVAMLFQFLKNLAAIFGAYFDDNQLKIPWDQAAIQENFTLVYELLDEVMDYGYPQNSSVEILKMYINTGEMKAKFEANQAALMPELTGAVDWRAKDIVHKKNEVFLDIQESIELLMSATGTVLRNEVVGVVHMKALLSGMPECKFGLNDKISMEAQGMGSNSQKKFAVEMVDCTFHRCVRLGKFDADRSITFVPPDGKFDLMQYRISSNIKLPFKLLPVIEESEEKGVKVVNITLKIKAVYAHGLLANKVVVKIPVPPTTARVKPLYAIYGSTTYKPEENAIVWKLKKFPGEAEFTLTAKAQLMPSISNKKWSRPPISCTFDVPMYTASGLKVRFLKIFERSGYKAVKWVRYLTKAGSYEQRI